MIYATDAIKEYGINRFAKGLMWVMQETLGMPKGWMLWEPDEPLPCGCYLGSSMVRVA